MEVVHLYWSDISFELQTARVTSKPDLGFYPKRWEEREVPIPAKLIEIASIGAGPRAARAFAIRPGDEKEVKLAEVDMDAIEDMSRRGRPSVLAEVAASGAVMTRRPGSPR